MRTLAGKFAFRRLVAGFFRGMTMNGRIVVGLAALLLGASPPAPPPPAAAPAPRPPAPTPDQVFEQLAHQYLDEFPRLSPVDATALGDHRFDDRLDDVGFDGWKA